MKRKRLFAMPELLILVTFVLVIGAAGWFFFHKSDTHADFAGGTGKVLAEMSNGGSTNFTGWDLKIDTNGSGVLHCDNGPQLNASCSSRLYKPDTFAAAALRKDLDDTNLKGYKSTCAYSASFGSVDTLVYKGVHTDGIDCYVQSEQTPLAKDLQAVLTRIGLQP